MLGKFFSLGRREIAPRCKFCDKAAKSPAECQRWYPPWGDREAAGSLATLPWPLLPQGTGCSPGTFLPTLDSPTDCTKPLTENSHSTSISTDVNFSAQILFFLKELCITFYLKGKLLIISLQIYSRAMLDITKVQNKLVSVLQFQIVSFSPLRCIMLGILMTPVNNQIFAWCVLVLFRNTKMLKCVI